MRTQSQINLIKNRIIDPFLIDSILTDNEIKSLVRIFEEAQGKTYKNTGPVTLDLPKDNLLLKEIISRLKEKLGPFEITAAFFFRTDYPHIIHNDDTFGLPNGVSKGITLPLTIEREFGEELPRLCFFDQFYFHGPAKFFNGSKDIPTYYNECLYDYKNVDGIIDTDFAWPTELLAHLKPQWLKGLSLHSTLEWKPGNALIFDSTRLHCASDFRQLGIKSKLGISIFTKI